MHFELFERMAATPRIGETYVVRLGPWAADEPDAHALVAHEPGYRFPADPGEHVHLTVYSADRKSCQSFFLRPSAFRPATAGEYGRGLAKRLSLGLGAMVRVRPGRHRLNRGATR